MHVMGPSQGICGSLVLVWLIALITVLRGGASAARHGVVRQQIDPNSAPEWELCTLSDIGEVTAREIIRFRDAVCAAGAVQAFRHAADLDEVRGIGPKTLARLSPHLRFDDRCP